MLSFVAVKNFLPRRVAAWAALAGVLAVFFFLLARLHPTNSFGVAQDDALGFSAAKALAEGKGNILPSVPGTPPNKYPILYPWLLSRVWRWNPSFPANVKDGVALTAAFSALFIIMMYFFLRTLRGLSEGEALFLAGFCGLGAYVVVYSADVGPATAFGALTLAALTAGNVGMRRGAPLVRAAGTGVLAGAAMLLHVLGVPVAAGILVAGATRSRKAGWRQLAVFSASVAPFFLFLAWHAISSLWAAAPAAGGMRSNSAWEVQWAYYTSFLTFWKMSIGHSLGAFLLSNAQALLLMPSTFFLYPLLDVNTALGRGVWALVSAGIAVGIVRQARRDEWRPIHFALPFYLAVLLFWYAAADARYILPFLPLFAAGLWFEGKHIFGIVRAALAGRRPASEKVLAGVLGLGLAVLAGGIAWNFVDGPRTIAEIRSRRAGALLEEKREAYAWLRGHSPADARVIADEDAMLYLYTGRQAARPAILLVAGIFEPARLQAQLAGICETAQAIGAEYWLMSDDDFATAWPKAAPKARARERELEQALPLAFRSGEGHVRIYSLGCVQHPDDPACRAADPVLFPSGSGGAGPGIR
jgi:hypothetical protein